MAILSVCSVFDSAVGAFGRPVFVPSAAVAMRSFGDEVNRRVDDNPMAAHPDDFTLHEVAAFDEETGAFMPPAGGVRIVARAKDLVRG